MTEVYYYSALLTLKLSTVIGNLHEYLMLKYLDRAYKNL